ncbi:glandular kallikrein, prostatic [Megalopta genalis]|uniref:glandular kallikrein, prostatic n=1 Tax=Megalopta genalis TaxID=115081 RepID=UPI0014430ADD|nr:glandular kallikrein, prostatic-like [Megalopta genalis]
MSMHIFLLFLLLINLNEYQTLLLRGKRVLEGQFPWLLQFQTISPCGGILLSSDWVLTAAQCVQEKRNSIILVATGLNGIGSRQSISVKATYIHPDYDVYSILPDRDHNIALLKLVEPFVCDAKITLPNVKRVDSDNYTSCFIFGWQSYLPPSSKVFAKPMQYNEVIINSWKSCTRMIKANTNYTNYTNVFCTMVEFKDGMEACAGNPGSPVVCENHYREIAVLGIASWSNFSLECGDLPTYLDLSIYRAWLYNLVLNNKTEKLDNNGSYTLESTRVRLQNVSLIGSADQEISTESINITKFWNKLHTPLNIESYISTSVAHNFHHYHHRPNHANNHEFTNLNRSSLYNGRFKTIAAERNNDTTEFNSFEFLLPLTIKNVVTSCSNIAITCKNIYFLIYILLYF